MYRTVVVRLGLCFLMLSLDASESRLKVMSVNCYAFPDYLVKSLGYVSKEFMGRKIDLVSGITKNISTRIAGIADFIKEQNPDVVVFQELWNDGNKKQMEKALHDIYPYIYWIPFTIEKQAKQATGSVGGFFKNVVKDPQSALKSEAYLELNPLKLDSGLMIASKFKLVKKVSLKYKKTVGDEVNAQKGALIALFYDDVGRPVLVVDTHLQSGRDLASVKTRQEQMYQLGKFLSQNVQKWGLDNPTFIVAGDMNEPLVYQEVPHRLIDRSPHLAKALQDGGIQVSNDEIVRLLMKRHSITGYLKVRELKEDAQLTTYLPSGKKTVRTIGGSSVSSEGKQLDPLLGRFQEIKNGKLLYTYFPEADDPQGIQQLVHFFLDEKSKVTEYKVFREEILGDTGPEKRYDAEVALSDHAAAMIELT